MAQWGEFQSVIQLAVALNAAYAALGTYLGSNLPTERRLIQELIHAIETASSADGEHTDPPKSLPTMNSLRELRLLNGKSLEIEQRYEYRISTIARPICILSSIGGIALLVVSSFFYGEDISVTWRVVSCLLMLPFFAGAFYSLYISVKVHFAVSKPRHQHESAYYSACNKIPAEM